MQAPRPLLRRLLRIGQILVTVVLLAVLVQSCTLEKSLETWQQAEARYLVLSAVLIVLTTIAGALSLLVLLESKGRWSWWLRFVGDYFHIQALCQLTPAQAAEIALPYVAGRGRFLPGEIIASLVIQRVVSLAIIVVVALLGARQWIEPAMLWFAALAVLAFCLALIATIQNASARNWLNRLISKRFGPIFFGFYESWKNLFQKRRLPLLLHFFLMLGRFALTVAGTQALLLAFGIQVPFLALAALSALATLAAVVPLSINGLGVTEGIFVAVLSTYGYATDQILTACLAGRALGILIFISWSAIYWFLENFYQTDRHAA